MSRAYPLERTRNIGIIAHIDAGKTTTTERILFYTGRTHRMGNVDDGTTVTDWMAQERERGITITAAAVTCFWHDCQVNIVDTPGHIDFTAEVVRSIRVIDGAVVILDAVGGVEPQTMSVWKHAERENLPRILFVNKLDRLGANCQRVMGEVHERLTPRTVSLQIPIGREEGFRGAVDLLTERALIWPDGADDPVIEPVSFEGIPTNIGTQLATLGQDASQVVFGINIQLHGTTLGGQEISSNAFRLPLYLCAGCTPTTCCSETLSAQDDHPPFCFAGQDGGGNCGECIEDEN